MEEDIPISWNDNLERLIAEEAERCTGQAWLHRECERVFASYTTWIALPVIILSTANGFLSGSSQMIFSNATTASIGIGAASLFTGVLSTVGSYFAWAKRTEAHRITAIQYNKLSHFLTVELTLPKKERIQAKDILKIMREDVERLLEISPAVPEFILNKYKKEFKDVTDVAHPGIIKGLNKVIINKDNFIVTPVEEVKSLYIKPEEKTVTVRSSR